MDDKMVELTMLVHRDDPSDDAILVQQDDDGEKFWLPRSQIEYEYTTMQTDMPRPALVSVNEWLALKRGLI